MCNAWNHPEGCTCGFGGYGHLGIRSSGLDLGTITINHYYPILTRYLNLRSAFSLTIPNAICPVCGSSVYFYQNDYGSRVFFDDLGPPWPKHPCTDNSRKLPRISSEYIYRRDNKGYMNQNVEPGLPPRILSLEELPGIYKEIESQNELTRIDNVEKNEFIPIEILKSKRIGDDLLILYSTEIGLGQALFTGFYLQSQKINIKYDLFLMRYSDNFEVTMYVIDSTGNYRLSIIGLQEPRIERNLLYVIRTEDIYATLYYFDIDNESDTFEIGFKGRIQSIKKRHITMETLGKIHDNFSYDVVLTVFYSNDKITLIMEKR